MAKPSSIPTWSTNPGTTVDPGPTRTASGFVTGKKAPAGWFNFLFNRLGAWLAYVNDLHNEPDFLNKNYSWTGAHKFAAGYSAGNWGVSGAMHYVNTGTGAIETRAITFRVPLGAFVTETSGGGGTGSDGWRYSGGVWTRFDDSTNLRADIHLPRGTSIVSASAGVYVSGGCTLTMGFGMTTTAGTEAPPALLEGTTTRTTDGIATASYTADVLTEDDLTQIRFATDAAAGAATVNWVKMTVAAITPGYFTP